MAWRELFMVQMIQETIEILQVQHIDKVSWASSCTGAASGKHNRDPNYREDL